MIARTQPTDLVRHAAGALHASADHVRQALGPLSEFRETIGTEEVPPEIAAHLAHAEGAVLAALAFLRRLTTALAERAARTQPQEGGNGS